MRCGGDACLTKTVAQDLAQKRGLGPGAEIAEAAGTDQGRRAIGVAQFRPPPWFPAARPARHRAFARRAGDIACDAGAQRGDFGDLNRKEFLQRTRGSAQGTDMAQPSSRCAGRTGPAHPCRAGVEAASPTIGMEGTRTSL